MKQIDLEFIKREHKWPFEWTDVFDRYFILVFPLFFIYISLMITYFSIKDNLDNGYTYLQVVIPIFLLGCLISYLIITRIKNENYFKIIPVHIDNKLELNNCIEKLNWTPHFENQETIVATTKISPFSWGETITIIIDEKQLLFNSMPRTQPFTFNRDKVNYRKICEALAMLRT